MRPEVRTVSARGFHGSSRGRAPESTALCRLVADKTEDVTATFDLFRDCWEPRDLVGARRAFERFHAALVRFLRFEERAVLAGGVRHGLVSHALDVVPHLREHASLEALAASIARSFAECEVDRKPVSRELVHAVERLETNLMNHFGGEQHELCCRLGRLVGPSELTRLAA